MTLRIPPVLQLAGFLIAAWLADWFLPGLDYEIGLVGLLLVVTLVSTASLIILAALGAFRIAKTTVNPVHPDAAAQLVTGGIFRLSRNPMYLGFAMLLAAGALALGNIAALAMPALFIAAITYLQIIPEEATLRAKFGAAYEQYCARTRRWL